MAPSQMVPRRARMLLRGSDIQPALTVLAYKYISSKEPRCCEREALAYKKAIAMYGQELMKPISHELLAQLPAASQTGPESGIPNATGKVKLAPLEPV